VEAAPIVAGDFPEDAGPVSGSTAAGDQGSAWSPVSMVADSPDLRCRVDGHRVWTVGDCQDLHCRVDDHRVSNFQGDDSLHSVVFPVARPAPVGRPALAAYRAAEEDPARTPAAFPW
jgi:hypothetical protein